MRVTNAAHCFTGQSISCDVAHCVMVSFLRSFFCSSKVMDTLSAECSIGAEWCRSSPFLRKEMFFSVSCRVRLFSGDFTLRYSQERHAKKKAPMMSWVVA